MTEFARKILRAVQAIPRGKTLTYKEAAAHAGRPCLSAGRPRAWRAVDNILNKNYNPEILCHRVIRSDGKIGGYNKEAKMKIKILQKEGIKFFTKLKPTVVGLSLVNELFKD